ncbi:MAG: nucleotidyltransferase family protein [Clostridiales bacterium]|jgi:glucose-1-phosphate thymidylyltransferase|nr:nucleotidyltransferase family protein [Clostridiales bacterium]
MKAIILAAGYATRLPIASGIPKPLLPVWGKPVISHIMEQIDGVDGVDEVYLVSNGKFAGHFEKWLESHEYAANITILNNGTKTPETRLGAIGDIIFAMEKIGLDDDVLIICGDNLFTFDLAEFVAFHKKTGGDCVCAKEVDDIEKLKSFAVATTDENGIITDFVEKPESPKSNLAVFGLYIYKKDSMAMLKQYIAEGGNPDAPGNFPQWLHKRKPIFCFKFKGECFDIGTLKAYEEVLLRSTKCAIIYSIT